MIRMDHAAFPVQHLPAAPFGPILAPTGSGRKPVPRTATPDEIISTALGAALDPARWTDVLDRIASHVPGGRVYLMRYWNDGRGLIDGQSVNYDPVFSQSYFAHFHRINPRVPALHKAPPGLPTANHQSLPAYIFRRSEFYNDWMRPQEDCYRGGGLLVSCWPSIATYVGADMPAAHADAAEEGFVALLGHVAPFLTHAARVNDALFSRRLDGLAAPVGPVPAWFLLAEQGQLLQANPEGEVMVDEGHLLRRDLRQRLRFGPAARPPAPLSELVAAGRCLRLRLEGFSEGRLSADISITPLPPDIVHLSGQHPLSLHGRRLVLLTVAQSAPEVRADALLARRLGLTLAEAAVAERLAQGDSIAEIAHARDRAEVTIRNQIKAACQKLGVRGQAGLVRSVLLAQTSPDRATG